MNFEAKDFNPQDLRWSNFERDDLKAIPIMVANGYTVEFESRDLMHKRITPDNVPMWAVSFRKGNLHTWKGYKNEYVPDNKFRNIYGYWICATLVDKHYTNHVHFRYLSMVVKYQKLLQLL